MNNQFRPTHLENYDVFGKLTEWRRGGPPEQQRNWDIRYFKGTSTHDNYAVHLSWRFGDGQLGGLNTVCASPEEAVCMALEEFTKWNRNYLKSVDGASI